MQQNTDLIKLYDGVNKIKQSDMREPTNLRGRNIPSGTIYNITEKAIVPKLYENNQNYFLISGDGRKDTRQIMQEMIDALTKNDIIVLYAGDRNITPLFELERKRFQISGANITASHQPHEYNGIKLVLEPNPKKGINPPEDKMWTSNPGVFDIQENAREHYISQLAEKFSHLKPEGKIFYDAMQGISFNFFNDIAERLGINVTGFRQHPDPYFSRTENGPDPLDINEYKNLNLSEFSLAGIVDGDGDRVRIALPSTSNRHIKMLDAYTMSAIRAIRFAEKSRNKNTQPNFVAEYALASVLNNYLSKKGINVIPVKRGRPSHISKIQELKNNGEIAIGGEIGLHHYNEDAIDDSFEVILDFMEIQQEKGRERLEAMVLDAKQPLSGIKTYSPEIRIKCNNQQNIVNNLIDEHQKQGTEKKKQEYGDAIFNLGNSEFIVHASDNDNSITINASSTKTRDMLEDDLYNLFSQINETESGLEQKLKQEYKGKK